MRRLIAIAGFGIMAAACASAARPVVSDGPPPVRAPSVYALLGERERLELDPIQVEALDSIGRWLASRTEQLEREFREGQRPDSAQIASVREALNEANRAAIEGVESVLRPEQRELVCAMQREAAEKRDRSRREAAVRGAGRGRMEAARVPGWSWCGEE